MADGPGQPPPADDQLDLLIARARGGNVEAFNTLIGYYQGAAFGVAFRILGERELAADATQEAIFAAFRAIGRFRGSSFRVWLLRIVTNQCLDELRSRKRRPVVSLDALLSPGADEVGEAAAQPADETWDPAGRAEQRELTALLNRLLLDLPEDQRIAVVLCDVEGLSYDEIAEVTQTNLGTVKSRIARARARLRDLLEHHRELLPRTYRRAPMGEPPQDAPR